ncbi:MAG: hypothetical protein ACTS1Z_05220 [Parasphingopyxis sp.]|uniref:hypothetical protein n=1 Tax=Parasphingopyxis sp. TaxID=1920299 RepID=UPI003FA14791
MIRARLALAPFIVLPLAMACADPGAAGDGDAAESGETVALPEPDIAPDEAAALEAQVAALYDDPFAVDTLNPPLPMTDELAALFAAERALVEASDGMPGNLDFAWHIDGQDAEITELAITHEPIAPGLVAVIARFENFGEPRTVRYLWAQQGADWRLADIVIGEAEDAMAVTLSEALRTR